MIYSQLVPIVAHPLQVIMKSYSRQNQALDETLVSQISIDSFFLSFNTLEWLFCYAERSKKAQQEANKETSKKARRVTDWSTEGKKAFLGHKQSMNEDAKRK